MPPLRIRRISYALGAEVRGIDLREPVPDGTFEEIRQAWLEHQLLCFPGQDLTKEQLLAFSLRFGPRELVKDSADPTAPGIVLLTNKPQNGKAWDGYKNGPSWHSDKSYKPQPTQAIFINCKEIPEVGGDTMFANMYMAYETLSPKMQELIEPLWAIHDRREGQIPAGMRLLAPEIVEQAKATAKVRVGDGLPCVHPVVRTHVDTKRKSLYLTERAKQFLGMTEEESRPLIDTLNQHSVRYEFTYRHRWTVGDLVMWDNRCMLHKALCDYDLRHDIRDMIRASTLGEEIGYYYTPEVEAAQRDAISQPVPA